MLLTVELPGRGTSTCHVLPSVFVIAVGGSAPGLTVSQASTIATGSSLGQAQPPLLFVAGSMSADTVTGPPVNGSSEGFAVTLLGAIVGPLLKPAKDEPNMVSNSSAPKATVLSLLIVALPSLDL